MKCQKTVVNGKNQEMIIKKKALPLSNAFPKICFITHQSTTTSSIAIVVVCPEGLFPAFLARTRT